MGELTPVPPHERVATLDVLRGFALLGVLLANLYVLYSFRFASHAEPSDSGADVVARWFMALFVHSRAQTLLTFLFGFGFAVQLVRARERGRRVLPLYLRRLFALLLLGFVAGARRWFDRDGADHRALFRTLLVAGALGTAVGIALEAIEITGVFKPADHALSIAMVAAVVAQLTLLAQVAAYVAIVVLLMQRPAWRRMLVVIAPVGRMPLTTYLMQSLICTSLFYGWGLDWRTPPPATCIGLGLAIFAVQIAIAHAWLRWFRFGPAEWVWRSIVYWQLPPMRSE